MKTPKGLHPLLEDGVIDAVLHPLKSGKEASVYVVRSGGETLCAKVYKDMAQRSFQARVPYQEGRKIRGSRRQRAIGKGSRFGRKEEEAAWKRTEVDALYRLAEAGVHVPRPHGYFDGVLLMALVVDAAGHSAPRLSEVELSPERARSFYTVLIRDVVRMLCLGLIHGDLSEYNVLVTQEGPVLIDFPQVVNKPKFQKFENILLRKESVNTHLRLAEEFFNKEQFIEPESENALDELSAIFSVDSENLKAKILQRKMLDVFVDQVKNYQAAKQYESAIISAQSGLKVSANDAFLKSSYKNLQKLYKVQQQVDNYLLLAKKQMDKGNYVTPINNNALKIYKSVFKIDVNNKAALLALKEIELKLVSQATQAIKSNNISNAKLILQLIEQFYPESKYLKKTQTMLAEAISSKDPAINKIVFSDVLLSSMEAMEDIRIQSGKLIYFGIQFKNFSRGSNFLLVKLLDHTAVTKILDKTIKIDGSKGEQIFSIEIPGKGLVPGNYYIELKHGKKSLIKKSFQIFKP